MIRGLTVWSLAILAFGCGFVAVLTQFGNQKQIAFLIDRTSQLGSQFSRAGEIDERIGELAEEFHINEQKLLNLEAKSSEIDRVQNVASDLSRKFGDFAAKIEAIQTSVDEKTSISKTQLANMELRLTELEKNQNSTGKTEKNDEGQSVAITKVTVSGGHANPLSNFLVVKVTGDAAMLAGPQGWFKVNLGAILPSGAKIVEISRRNNHAFVLTDQGIISNAR